MLDKIIAHKFVLLMAMLCMMLCSSIGITLAYQNTLTDSISITTSIFLGLTLCVTVALFILDQVRLICNP